MASAPAAAAAALALALASAGCGGGGADAGTAPVAEPARSGSGWFEGSGDGLGASLDLRGEDAVARAVGDAVAARARPPARASAVGIAAVVNDRAVPVPAPRFTALFEGGGALPLTGAHEALEGLRGPAARRARALLGRPPRAVPAGGAVTMYVVLRGARPDEVASARMVALPGEPIALPARTR
ncbi:hypothetical protein [Miltoncostaea marina]|uniref:hypothetical protein n=1 Tax=Miltoncostaea marina TaxID=2843215 RepID=UPI001C3C316E|nr:hypothetical protein [Miltoncostaea marina]